VEVSKLPLARLHPKNDQLVICPRATCLKPIAAVGVDSTVDMRYLCRLPGCVEREGFVRIGELAKRSGFAESQIRYYERRGLLPRPGRSESGYRLYGEADVGRLQLIRRAKLHGLPLSEAAELLELAESGCCEQTEPAAQAAVERRIADVDDQVAELQALRAALAESPASWPPEPAEACGGAFCLPYGSDEAALREAKVPERRLRLLGDGCCEPGCGPETCGS